MHDADSGDLEHDPLGKLRGEEGREEERRRGKKEKKEMGQGKNGNKRENEKTHGKHMDPHVKSCNQ